MQSIEDAARSIAPSQKHGLIEVDTFCTGCHYNLHGQVVSIDERLGFPICRCPECGRFHPAGVGVTASGVWLRRWAGGLLFTWVLTVLLGFFATIGLICALDASSIGAYTNNCMAAPDGQPVNWTSGGPGAGGMYVIEGTNTVIKNPIYVTKLYPWTAGIDQPGPGWLGMVFISAGSLVLGLLVGLLGVTLMWHWPRWRYYLCLLVPIMPAALVTIPFLYNNQFMLLHTQCIERIAFQAAIGCTGLLLGVKFGRTISRTIIRIVIPPKPRQALAFLWQVDGKNLSP